MCAWSMIGLNYLILENFLTCVNVNNNNISGNSSNSSKHHAHKMLSNILYV